MKYIRKISGIEYEIKNYDDKDKYRCNVKDRSYREIRGYPIINPKKYNI